jgi:hypothetical protein
MQNAGGSCFLHEWEAVISKALEGAAIVPLLPAFHNAGNECFLLARRVKRDEIKMEYMRKRTWILRRSPMAFFSQY